MRSAALTLATIATCLLGATATRAEAADSKVGRLTLSMTAATDSGSELVVEGAGGRYDRVAQGAFRLPLSLAATLTADASAYKIVASELALKADGSAAPATQVETVPVSSISRSDDFAFGLAAQGPVAQNAIAACNGLSADERTTGKRSMTLALVWRVTTGRFAFQWTNYDRVAPSHDILNNRDFYAEQETQSIEMLADITVHCQPMTAAAVAAAPMAERPIHKANLIATPVTLEPDTATTTVRVRSDRPQCDGGMVRQVSNSGSSYLCLCPGNTERVAKGENAFACEKRSRRR